jgi:EAL and modified HD-GYP domain-containing signal transduction protein
MSHGEVFAARQPIFDRHNLVSGYEILFRSGPENRFIAADSDLAASQSLERTLMTFGLEHLTEGKDCFVNISRRVLVSELYTLLPVQRSVIELLETVAPDSEVIQACRRLKDSGYRLALDDFTYRPEFDPLLELADVVKIDFRQAESRARAAIEQSGRYGSNLLAEKVETQGERSEAEGLGFQLFQGYFFCRPEMMINRVPTPSRANYLRLLREVAQHDLEFERIEAIIRQEVAFSIRLLRYLNSAGFGWRHEVDTIGHALRLLGVRQVQKWISAVATVGLAEGKPPALVATALVRARLAELLAEPVGLTQADLQLFFGGLLSLMDAMMDQPLDQIVGSMGVSPELAAGLLRREPPFGPVLDLVVAQERGEWDRLESIAANLGAPMDQVQTAYRSASSWAASLINAA